jgi:hypothetical protein
MMAKGMRSSDPGWQPPREAHATLRWDAATTERFTNSEMDRRIRSHVDATYDEHKAQDKTELDEI